MRVKFDEGHVGAIRINHGETARLKATRRNHLVDDDAGSELLTTDEVEVGLFESTVNQRQEMSIVVVGAN